MTINGVKLDSRQQNFFKELMGDVFMTDTRAEATLAKACAKYSVDPKVLTGIGASSKQLEKVPPSETL